MLAKRGTLPTQVTVTSTLDVLEAKLIEAAVAGPACTLATWKPWAALQVNSDAWPAAHVADTIPLGNCWAVAPLAVVPGAAGLATLPPACPDWANCCWTWAALSGSPLSSRS